MKRIGIDLGGTNIAAGLVDDDGNILFKASTPTLAQRPAEEIAADMAKVVFEICKKGGVAVSDIDFCGIASPGVVDSKNGIVEYACNLPFNSYPIAEKLTELTGLRKILIANDANAAAKGEAEVGAAKGTVSSVMITLGTGVGGGIILNGEIYTGFNFAGAELGHIVISKDGRPCTCGRKGCWERYSSATGLIITTKEKMEKCPDSLMWEICGNNIDRVNGRTAFDAMRKGDKAGKEVVDEYIEYLACGIASVINIFQPEVLSIGGGISNEGDNLLIPLKKIVDRNVYTKDTNVKATDIRIAKLKNDAGIVGAAMLINR